MADKLKNQRGKILTLRDISRRKQVEIELREANQKLVEQISQITKLQKKLREESIRDYLTGLFNRRYLEETMDREIPSAERNERNISIVLLDIDHFKRINDKYGHPVGDQDLVHLSKMLVKLSRKSDIVCRYGGEEFIVVIVGASMDYAYKRADYWRSEFEKNGIEIDEKTITSTFSVGISSFPGEGHDWDSLLIVADKRLFQAKDPLGLATCRNGNGKR